MLKVYGKHWAIALVALVTACKSTAASEATSQPAIEHAAAAAVVAESPKSNVDVAAYSVALTGPSQAKVGSAGTLKLSVTPKAPFHCNADYPYSLKLEPSAALSLSGEPLTKDAFKVTPEGAILEIPFTPKTAGTHVVSGLLKFSVCKDDQCLVERQTLSVSVQVGS